MLWHITRDMIFTMNTIHNMLYCHYVHDELLVILKSAIMPCSCLVEISDETVNAKLIKSHKAEEIQDQAKCVSSKCPVIYNSRKLRS